MLTTTQFEALSFLPGLAVVKNTDSVYLGLTTELANIVGWHYAHDAIYKTDHDIPCRVAEFASDFIALDKKVLISKKKLITLDIQPYVCGWKLLIIERLPIFDQQGEAVGLFSKGLDVTDVDLFKKYLRLHQYDEKLKGKNLKPTSYVLNEHCFSFSITEKQANCLFLLIRGKTVKEIAKILRVSPRTIESHMEALKIKLNCRYKTELIEKAIDSGFLYYIPQYFQNNSLDAIIS